MDLCRARELAQALQRAVLEPLGQSRFVYRGNCMRPFLTPGDVLCVQAVPPDQLRSGDLLVFDRGDEVFVHRLLWGEGPLHTKADRYLHLDPALRLHALHGRVERIVRDGLSIPLTSPRIRWAARGIALVSGLEALGAPLSSRLLGSLPGFVKTPLRRCKVWLYGLLGPR